jgi:hypothetical protein
MVSIGASGGAEAETTAGTTGSSVGVGVVSDTSGSGSCQPSTSPTIRIVGLPSAFLRSARPFRLLAASVRSCSRSFSRCSFSR